MNNRKSRWLRWTVGIHLFLFPVFAFFMKVINLRMYGYINIASLGLHKLSKYLSVLLLTYINERYYKRSGIFKKDGHSVQN